MDWRRYSKRVRTAQRTLPRFEHPVAISLAFSLLFAVLGMSLLNLVGIGLGAGLQQLGTSVVGSLPQAKGEGQIVLTEQQVTISAAPVLDALPEFTKSNAVTIGGKVPAFAALAGRQIEVALNGSVVSTVPLLSDGRFSGGALTLPDGTSTIIARLIDGATEVAVSSATVVVDRSAPALTITRPKANETVEGPELVIEGKTEPDAEVTVSGRALRPNPDGTFADRISAPIGPLTLQIAAKDKAGNETKTALSVTVKQSSLAPAAAVTLGITLDRVKVRPGQTVVVKMIATENGKPKADLSVTLQVGVFTVGTYKTDATGVATVGFAAPDHEADDVAIVALGGGTAARATLTVSNK
ncbi:MAG: hypothetical protein HYY42_05270 [Chloroflexi bacterium]|nr:hypothetical protein [Chloroflexota bacterium]